MRPARRHILIADDDHHIRRMLVRALEPLGHSIETAIDGRDVLEKCAGKRPDLLLLDLMMPRLDGIAVLRRLRGDDVVPPIQVVVLTARLGRQSLQDAFDAGADDFMSKPFDLSEVVARVKAQMRIADYRAVLDHRRRDAQILLDISHRLTRNLDVQGILQDITGMVAEVLDADRCSVVLIGDDGNIGRVVAASDDARLTDRTIDLEDYPEIRQVLATREPVVAEDISADPLFDPVKENLERLEVRSAALFPMMEGDRCIGVLFLRSTRPTSRIRERQTQFGSTVANATAVAVTNARLFYELKAESDRISHARAVVEQRLARVQRYEDFFENSADGMLIAGPDGRLRFVNREAERITRKPRGEVIGQPFAALMIDEDQNAARALIRGAVSGDFSRRVDLRPAGTDRIMSVSAARVPGEDTIGLTARDVTDERAMAGQLDRARQQLAEQEKLTVIAEVAGATAHELNQPLTSVMGYAELLDRRIGDDPLARKAATTIQREAERMAAIVRRIGRLTRYETRPYVGGVRILDLEASALATGEFPALKTPPPFDPPDDADD